MPNVVIIDYGMGNLDSMCRAVVKCGGDPTVSSRAEDLRVADKVILPGVGAFPQAMQNLRARNLVEPLRAFALQRPLLGVCLGMQLFASSGTEIEETPGLDLIKGRVERINPSQALPVPHIGWNELSYCTADSLFAGIPEGKDFYFVHSYHLVCSDAADLVATTGYGGQVTAAVRRGLVHGVQFHPEKSQKFGFQLLRNFLAM